MSRSHIVSLYVDSSSYDEFNVIFTVTYVSIRLDELTGHGCRDEKIHFLVGSGVQFECVKADAMKRFVVYEERFITVGDQVTRTEDGVVRFDDHFRHLHGGPKMAQFLVRLNFIKY